MATPCGRQCVLGLVAAAVALLVPALALGQAIPRDTYLSYVPLEYPRIVAQNEASVHFQLYGDRNAAGYRDEAPVDGVDDRRGEILMGLAERFGPIMIQNTIDLPMEFRHFMERTDTWNLYVDTWNTVGTPKSLLRSDSVNLRATPQNPCPGATGRIEDQYGQRDLVTVDDCLLLDLLDEFDPFDPQSTYQRQFVIEQSLDPFKVLFFDFPGEDPQSWKQEFEQAFSNELKREFVEFVSVYVHPYIHEVSSDLRGERGYEFVLQYYFFYPYNDGGNNHEGDWEHINVRMAPLDGVDRLLTAEEVEGILAEGAAFGGEDNPLVIASIDYYLHHQFMRVDFSRPNAYLPRAEWEEQVETTQEEGVGQKQIWKLTRRRCFLDDEETLINTHPVCFIGGDNKGFDQVLAKPGGTNRDSHATYPFPGLYKDIGPGGASEQVSSQFDIHEYYLANGGSLQPAVPRYGRGQAVPFVTQDRLVIVPDWERVIEPVRDDPVARRDWCWMLLPIRWGYPATVSPFAGVVPHAETGNLAPTGPHYQGGWNHSGSASGFHDFSPHSFDSLFPMGLQDTFQNSWGYLNLTLPVIGILPPFDLIFRIVPAPFKAALGHQDRVYFPKANIPFRFLSLVGAATKLGIPEETVGLLFTGENGVELLNDLFAIDDDIFAAPSEAQVENPWTWLVQTNLFLGRRFGTQNALMHSRSDVGFQIYAPNAARTVTVNSQLNQWEFSGSLRYNLNLSDFQPYLKLGYGWTWYRLEDISIDGENLTHDTSQWFNKPSFDSFSDIWPNSWHYGFGLEIIVIKSYASLPKGIDLGVELEMYWTRYELGQDLLSVIVTAEHLDDTEINDLKVTRPQFAAGLTLSF